MKGDTFVAMLCSILFVAAACISMPDCKADDAVSNGNSPVFGMLGGSHESPIQGKLLPDGSIVPLTKHSEADYQAMLTHPIFADMRKYYLAHGMSVEEADQRVIEEFLKPRRYKITRPPTRVMQ